jgi:exonuclease SbcC
VIPQRVKLKGFLCYKGEQAIGFDGNATLWMLSGLNGSGKSSVFDAVTYALFGHHRGGGTHAVELINKDSDTLAVEFDFLLDGKFFRAKRTLRRDTRGGARGTQQMFRYEGGSDGNGRGAWVPIEGTSQKREFDAWVAENIGLNYETFTSSVLLLQGKAEKLLDSKPEGRREVLARIVDLERYEQLHRKADDQRKALEGRLKELNNRLAALPAVLPLELAAADKQIEKGQEERAKARAEVERLHEVEIRAKGWRELQERLTQTRARHARAEALLGEADTIERAMDRLRDLRDVLPRLNEITLLRNSAHQAEEQGRDLAKQKGKLAEMFAQREAALEQARSQRSTLQGVIDQEEAKQREVVGKLRGMTAQMERLRECERQEAELSRIREELGRLPNDPERAVKEAGEACAELEAAARAVPLLERFRGRREELRGAVAREQAGREGQEKVRRLGEERSAEVEKLRPVMEQAARALQRANEESASARTLLKQAQDSLRDVSELDGARVCRHCGQALTEGHIEEEKHRRGAEVERAEAAAHAARQTQQKAQAEDRRARGQMEQAEKALHEARLEYRDCTNQAKQAEKDVERLQGEVVQAHADLPEPYCSRVSAGGAVDWLATVYPGEEDLRRVKEQAGGLPRARQERERAEQVRAEWSRLKVQEEAGLQAVGRLAEGLPIDREGLRREHQRLELMEQTLERRLAGRREESRGLDGQLEELVRRREECQREVADADARLKEQEMRGQHARQTIAKVVRALPEGWRADAERAGVTDYMRWNQEKTDLEEGQTEERWKQLQQARVGREVLLQEQAELEAREKEYPEEARQDPAQIADRLREAREADRARDEELSRAREQKALLDSYLRQRVEVEQEALAVEDDVNSQRLLAELLGRDRLQLYLVRQAERQVVEYANVVLDRLSGGQLYLKLVGGEEGEGSLTKALELEAYNRSTGEKPINVAFLSGSQKFRVAVSLALGIGQYASRQHRPIESVIIDEGFGCLDTQGRQVMIQELQNLRGQMRCILLVSHQEEFAEAFPDGYHFRLEGGTTEIRRFQR